MTARRGCCHSQIHDHNHHIHTRHDHPLAQLHPVTCFLLHKVRKEQMNETDDPNRPITLYGETIKFVWFVGMVTEQNIRDGSDRGFLEVSCAGAVADILLPLHNIFFFVAPARFL